MSRGDLVVWLAYPALDLAALGRQAPTVRLWSPVSGREAPAARCFRCCQGPPCSHSLEAGAS